MACEDKESFVKRRRVVITGVSAITPLGRDVQTSWKALLEGKSGIGKITLFDASDFPVHIAGEVPDFHPQDYIQGKQCQRMDRFTQFAVCAAKQLMADAQTEVREEEAGKVGVIMGIGIGGMNTIEQTHTRLTTAGPGRVSPFSIPMYISNMAPGQIAIAFGAKGLNVVATSACTSSLHAIGWAYDQIVLGRSEMIITGGSEAAVTPMSVAGFASMKALCADHQDDPEHASRPFDASRAGFVLGEGAGLLLLESLERAKQRGAKIYAEVLGWGASDDAHHMVAPLESGAGMAACMRNALADAGIRPESVQHVSAHGTSTHANDAAETKALHEVFGAHAGTIAITAVKSQIGHLLGASGGVAAVFEALALQTGMVPGTLNLNEPDPECDLNYLSGGAQKLDPAFAMVNSYGFGGTNGSLVLAKYRD